MNQQRLIEDLQAKVDREGFHSLTFAERVVHVLTWADFEIVLGGVSGYLYNSAGNMVVELPDAFREIGCPASAAAAQRVVELLAARCSPADRGARYEVIKDPSPELDAAMDELGRHVTDHPDEWGKALDRFMTSHFAGTPARR